MSTEVARVLPLINCCFHLQWECKTDLDNSYRFGRIEVSCEGYNHPTDAYVLKGSCGLEYTLELTEEGRRRTQGNSWGFDGGFKGFKGRCNKSL